MKISLNNNHLTATIDSKGAELQSLQKISTSREYIWEGNPVFWGKHSPILFPIVGALKNNQYECFGKTYSLSRHGFARDREFALISQSETKAVFSLKSDDETLANYPFDFELQLIYTLEENCLIVAYKVINNSMTEMPFSIGGHPAFSLPDHFNKYSLSFEYQETLNRFCLENDLLSDTIEKIELREKKLSLDYGLFESDALVFKSMLSKKITLLENNQPLLNFSFEDFPHFGIWTKPDAPFLCLEPWIGYSDTINHNGRITEKEGIQILAAQSDFHCEYKIEIR